jgi:hypothetical protein
MNVKSLKTSPGAGWQSPGTIPERKTAPVDMARMNFRVFIRDLNAS